MDIAALSTQLSQANLKQDVGISLMKMVKEQTSVQTQGLTKLIENSVQPHLGGNVDLKI